VPGSDIIDLGGPVHVADYGGSGPLIVLVHGLEGSHLNWLAVGPGLAEHHRVIAPDLSGFGLTPPSSRGATVDANAVLVHELIRKYGDAPATVIGNSMGGLIAMIATVGDPSLVEQLVLVDPALPAPRLVTTDPEVLFKIAAPTLPLVGGQFIRFYHRTHTPEEHARESMRFVCADPDTVPDEVRSASMEMIRLRRRMDWAVPSFVEATRSIARYSLNRKRFLEVIHRIAAPTLLIHGAQDRLVDPAAAEWVVGERPDWDLRMWDETGHVPMMEHPERFISTVLGWDRTTAGFSRRW